MTVLLVITAGVLCGCGTYLLLSRQLSRVIIGVGLFGNGVNLLLVLSGGRGTEPSFVGSDSSEVVFDRLADPLSQAFVLTAIVISFGVIAFLLALSYRSWRLTDDDEVEDDLEDRRIAATSHKPDQLEDRW